MDAPRLLSICIPTYNRAKLVERQLTYVLSEARPYLAKKKIEVLVSNNASVDETDIVMERIRKRQPDFDYFVQSHNIGAVLNIKFLVNRAKGRYIWVVGDDDYLKPGTIRRVIGMLEQYENENLGAIFLKAVWLKMDTDLKNIDWENLDRENMSSGKEYLLRYSENAVYGVCYSPFSGRQWDLMFITGAVCKRDVYRVVWNSENYKDNNCTPLAASLLCVLNRTFIIDDSLAICGGVDISWEEVRFRVGSVDLFRAIYNLRYLGYPDRQIDKMLDYFLKNHLKVRMFSPIALWKKKVTLDLIIEFYHLLRITGKRRKFFLYTCTRALGKIKRDTCRWGTRIKRLFI